MKSSVQRLCWLFLLSGVLTSPVRAANTAAITVKVTVNAGPSCVINNNGPIELEFGSAVLTTEVDGSNYKKPINYTLTCTGNTSNAMKMQISGTGATFDAEALQTDKADLAIALFNGGTQQPVNSWFNFTYPNKPVLTAAPVKKAGIRLVGGEFSAAATMKVDYQ